MCFWVLLPGREETPWTNDTWISKQLWSVLWRGNLGVKRACSEVPNLDKKSEKIFLRKWHVNWDVRVSSMFQATMGKQELMQGTAWGVQVQILNLILRWMKNHEWSYTGMRHEAAFQTAAFDHYVKNGLWRGESRIRWRVLKSSLNLVMPVRAIRRGRWTC